jgi:zinc transporter 1/2/3
MDLLGFKYVSGAIIFATTLLGAISALFVKTLKWRSRLEALAGGAFLAAGLLHMLPDAAEELEQVDNLRYPLAPTAMIGVFLIFTLIDTFSMDEAAEPGFPGEERQAAECAQRITEYCSLPEIGDGTSTKNATVSERFGTDMSGFDFGTLSLYIIMGLDATIEGLALGILQKWSKTIAILCAIVAHKPVESFAMSLILLRRRPTKLGFIGLVLFYCALPPLGLALGIMVQHRATHMLIGIIEACSAGAFLFMGCHEWMGIVATKEGRTAREKLWHYGAFLVGVLWLAVVAVMEGMEEK